MSQPHEIAIIAAPRCGTNFFCDTLGSFGELANFFELFNPRGVFGLERLPAIYDHLGAVLGKKIEGVSDPDLIKYAAADPVQFLAELRSGIAGLNKTAFSYKIFPGQLSRPALENVLSNPDRRYIFIVRNRIDTFISFKKAMEIDNWVNRPTDELKITVSYDEFMEWAARQDKWYARAEAILRRANLQYMAFSYDADINVPKETLVEKQYLALRGLGVKVSFPQQISPAMFRRQDKQVGPFKKIANGEDLKRTLLEKKMLGRYALRNPLIQGR